MRRNDYRRIDFFSQTEHLKSRLVQVLKETKGYFVIDAPTLPQDYNRIRTCFSNGNSISGYSEKEYTYSKLTWKPHEYRQEARQSCLFAYWFLKRRLGKDPAGIIAKFVWSTRFEEIWENEEEED